MSDYLYCGNKFTRKALEYVDDDSGKPVIFDTGIVDHNFFLKNYHNDATIDKWRKEGIFILGGKGKKITIKEIKSLLNRMDRYCERPALTKDRSYFFEGVASVGDRHYVLCWGS